MKKLLTLLLVIMLFQPYSVLAINPNSLDLESTSSQYASVADTVPLSITGDLSLEAWINLESLPANNGEMVIAGKGQTDSTFADYSINVLNDAGNLYFRAVITDNGNAAFAVACSAGADPATATWQHFAITFIAAGGANTSRCFINGAFIEAANSGAKTIDNSASAFYVGQEGDTSKFFDGLVDDVRVWNVARTDTQISDNYNCALAGTESNLVGYWKLDDNYNDSTSNAANLTASGAPVFSTTVNFTADCGAGGAPPTVANIIWFE